MQATELLIELDRPFPGLRSFESQEALIFFGREEHTAEILDRLSENRFLAIVGTSGTGKSSLVRAGLLPALYRGHLHGTTSHWRIAVMRPGGDPINALDAALASADALGPNSARRLATLRKSSMGLVDAVRESALGEGESLLVIVDQFEELFRFKTEAQETEEGGESALFVSLLIRAIEQHDVPIFVVLTMRSDFLGDCAQFAGLAEILSRSQYLIPRMSREQRQRSMERPPQVAGVEMTERLVQELLADAGDDPDQLPILQHALMATHLNWKQMGAKGPIDLVHYHAAGGVQNALDRQAQRVYGELGVVERGWAAGIFRCLTVIEKGRAVRRPMRLGRLCEVVGANEEREREMVRRVIQQFREHEASLLFSSTGDDLREESIIDIQHESVIWKWSSLSEWAKAEQISAEWYRDVAHDALAYSRNESDLWRDPKLVRACEIRAREKWNAAWAQLYWPAQAPGFQAAIGFLDKSSKAQRMEKLKRRGLVWGLVVASISLLVFFYRLHQANKEKQLSDQVISKLQTDRDKQEQRVNDLVARLSDSSKLTDKEKQLLEKELAAARAGMDESSKTIQQLKSADLSDTVRALQARVESLQKERDTAVAKGAALQTELDTATAKLTKLQTDLDAATAKVKELQAALDKLTPKPPTGADPKQMQTLSNPGQLAQVNAKPVVQFAADSLFTVQNQKEIQDILSRFQSYLLSVGLKGPVSPPTIILDPKRPSKVGYDLSHNQIGVGPLARGGAPDNLRWAYAAITLWNSVPHSVDRYIVLALAQYYVASFYGDFRLPPIEDASKPRYNWPYVFLSVREAIGKEAADRFFVQLMNSAGDRGSADIDSYLNALLTKVADQFEGGKFASDIQGVLAKSLPEAR